MGLINIIRFESLGDERGSLVALECNISEFIIYLERKKAFHVGFMRIET